MAQESYYVDACIWLNLFKKEGDPTKGVPFWKIAKEFIEKVMFSENELLYSGFVLKEIRFDINNEKLFQEKQRFFKDEENIRFVKATPEDYDLARKYESESEFKISFFDCMHTALSKRLNSTLITRDNLLIEFAKLHVDVKKPEELLS